MMKEYPNIGGYHPDGGLWPIGSIFEIEGQRLYDLVRDEKPLKVIEIGAHHGCSTTWIATALKENGKGKLYSYDINPKAWDMLPAELLPWVELINADALKIKDSCDLLFEDGMHTTGFTSTIIRNIKAPVVVCHDYMHWDCGKTVKGEFDAYFEKPDEIFFKKPSDCGLAIKWIR